MKSPWTRLSFEGFVQGLAVLGLLVPALWWILGAGTKMLGLAAPDTFYYLVVARNIVQKGLISFDGEFPTNAFHPLWQAIATLAFGATRVFTERLDAPLSVLLVIGALLVAAAIWLLGRTYSRVGAISPLWPIVPLGVMGLGILLALDWRTQHGTLWMYVNGMESGVLLLFYAWLGYAYVGGTRQGVRRGVMLGTLCLSVALSRLDHAVIPLLLLGTHALMLGRSNDRDARRYWLSAAATFVVGLLLYLGINKAYAGAALPVSGSIKSTLPFVDHGNTANLVKLLGDPKSLTRTLLQRQLQMVVPAVSAGLWLLSRVRITLGDESLEIRLRGNAPRLDLWLSLSAVSVIVLAAYNFFFTEMYGSGPWYMPVGVLFVTLAFVRWLDAIPWRRVRGLPMAAAILCAAASAVMFVLFVFEADPGATQAKFLYDIAPKARAFYADRPIRLISSDDGIVAYGLGLPTLNGLGFAIDAQAKERMGDHRPSRRTKLFELGFERGHDRITTCMYTGTEPLPRDRTPTSDELLRYFRLVPHPALRGKRLEAEFISEDRSFVVAKVLPR